MACRGERLSLVKPGEGGGKGLESGPSDTPTGSADLCPSSGLKVSI